MEKMVAQFHVNHELANQGQSLVIRIDSASDAIGKGFWANQTICAVG